VIHHFRFNPTPKKSDVALGFPLLPATPADSIPALPVSNSLLAEVIFSSTNWRFARFYGLDTSASFYLQSKHTCLG